MVNNRALKTAFIISLTGHLLVFGMLGINMNLSSDDKQEKIDDIIVTIEIEKPSLLPKIDTMGQEKKLPEPEPEAEEVVVKEEPLKEVKEYVEIIDPDSEAMLRYQDMVKQRIESARRYPAWAKRQGIEGIVHINFTVLSNGVSRDIKVARSSGFTILDKEAARNVKRANPFPPIPENIKTSSIKMDVSIVYTLK